MPIKVNSLEQTAETQISRQKSSINQNAVFHQITKNKPLLSRQKIADKPICCVPQNNNKPNHFINFFKLPIKVLSRTDCRNSNIQTKIANKPICCVPPNNNKPNPFINFFKMPIKVNSLEQTAETQISRQNRR